MLPALCTRITGRFPLQATRSVCTEAAPTLSRKEKRKASLKTGSSSGGPHILQGRTGRWGLRVGLELHVQLKANSKLFSGASSTAVDCAANTQVAGLDMALPGTLPRLNVQAVRVGALVGLAIGGTVNKVSAFDRKHYFYPDLPLGFQITQKDAPIVTGGCVTITGADKAPKTVRVERIQVEQDSGKSIHDQPGPHSLIDLNRAGVALLEIVSAPDMSSPEEASSYLKKLSFILRHVGACDAANSLATLRCDVNVSVHSLDSATTGGRVEIKNLTSISAIENAIEYEALRQVGVLEDGGTVLMGTRRFDVLSQQTVPMRAKDSQMDYRFMPEPDLPPVLLDDAFISSTMLSLPELPDQMRARLQQTYSISEYLSSIIVAEGSGAFFERVAQGRDAVLTANWVVNEVLHRVNLLGWTFEIDGSGLRGPGQQRLLATQVGDLLDMLAGSEISGQRAKELLNDCFAAGDATQSLRDLAVKKAVLQVRAPREEVQRICEAVVLGHPDEVAKIRDGKSHKVFSFLVGQAMKRGGGVLDPKLVAAVMRDVLNMPDP